MTQLRRFLSYRRVIEDAGQRFLVPNWNSLANEPLSSSDREAENVLMKRELSGYIRRLTTQAKVRQSMEQMLNVIRKGQKDA